MANQDRLYFDGQCPLCSFEMRHLANKKHDSLELLDIHSLPDLTKEQRESLLKTLHRETHSGEVLLGLEASRYAWSKTSWSGLFSWLAVIAHCRSDLRHPGSAPIWAALLHMSP